MSLNLCADAYLMAFAEKSQILALTPQSRDPSLFAFRAAAKNFPISDGRIENIATLNPDLVIVSSFSDPLRNRLIESLGVEILVMNAANNFADARNDILKLGQALHRQSEAQDYIAQLDTAMASVSRRKKNVTILPLQRRNLTAGREHIMDEIISFAGGINKGRAQKPGAMHRLSLERALASDADYILLSEKSGRPNSRGMEFLSHPAFIARYDAAKRLYINNNLLVCAGATTPLAIAELTRQLSD